MEGEAAQVIGKRRGEWPLCKGGDYTEQSWPRSRLCTVLQCAVGLEGRRFFCVGEGKNPCQKQLLSRIAGLVDSPFFVPIRSREDNLK